MSRSPGGAVEEPDGASERAGHDARIAELEATLSRQRKAEQQQLALFDSARERLEEEAEAAQADAARCRADEVTVGGGDCCDSGVFIVGRATGGRVAGAGATAGSSPAL